MMLFCFELRLFFVFFYGKQNSAENDLIASKIRWACLPVVGAEAAVVAAGSNSLSLLFLFRVFFLDKNFSFSFFLPSLLF